MLCNYVCSRAWLQDDFLGYPITPPMRPERMSQFAAVGGHFLQGEDELCPYMQFGLQSGREGHDSHCALAMSICKRVLGMP